MSVTPRSAGVRLKINPGTINLDDVMIGDSIAHNGVCLTVTEWQEGTYTVDISTETLDCTVGLNQPGAINLEKSLRLSDRLGGHLVSGHVDGTGQVLACTTIGEDRQITFRAPSFLAGYIATKGSICINGVSLTVNSVDHCDFSVNLIPHTLAVTTLNALKIDSKVNLEVDLVARYICRMHNFSNSALMQETPLNNNN